MAPVGIKVLLVRHAQSMNNIVQAGVQTKIKQGVSPVIAQVATHNMLPQHTNVFPNM